MRILNKIAALVFVLALPYLAQPANAQIGPGNANLQCPTSTPGVWTPCGGSANPIFVQGTFSASLGGFTPSASGARMTALSVTTSDSSGNLPSGTVAVIGNVGTNPMYCNVNGIAATTADQLITSSGGWFAFTIPTGITTLHCIATGGSTTANGVGGAGLPTGTGGGGGGSGGGGAVYGPTANGTAAANPPVVIGGTVDGTGTGAVSNLKITAGGVASTALNATPTLANGNGIVPTQGGNVLSATNGWYGNVLQGNAVLSATNGLYTNLLQGNAVIASGNPLFAQLTAGTALAGKFGIDQTTVGTTNGVSIAQIGATTVATGNGVSGAGSQRVNIASDNTAFSVNATLQASATTAIGKVDPNTIGSWGLMSGTVPGTAPTNTMITGGIYNSSAPTLSTGQTAPFQFTSAGSLHSTVDNTLAAIVPADNVANPAAGASPVEGLNALWDSAGTQWVRMPGTAAAGAQVNVKSGGFASGAVASGAFASGAYASGSIGSGAVAAGAVVSGAYLSGSLASGAVVDITNMSASTSSAPPSKAIYLGANASGATGGNLKGLIACDSHVFKHITSATDTLAVQGVASQSVYVCNWRSRAAGTATWFLENTASANANCSSTNTQINGLASEAVNSGEIYAPSFWQGLKNTSGNGLCINSTGTGGVDVDVWYAQF
jgi:hypothetical protein